MKFGFDSPDSQSNKSEHGIDFDEAQELWNDPHLLEIETRSTDERRYLLIGAKHWSAVATYREDKVRSLSVRCSRNKEVELYEES